MFKKIKTLINAYKASKKQEPFGEKDVGVFNITDYRKGRYGEKIETSFPEEGGSFTQIGGSKELFPGYPDDQVVQRLSTVKRMVPAALDAYYPFFKRHTLDPKRYSRPVREVYRIFNILIEREVNKKHKDRWQKVRDIACVILEFDSAYRFRFQDVLSELDKEQIKLDKADDYWMKKSCKYKINGSR